MSCELGGKRTAEPTHWVVIRLSALGDVVLATGVLERLHRERGWTFTVLTREAMAPVLRGLPSVEKVEAVPQAALHGAPWRALCRDLARTYGRTGHGLLDLHGSLRSRILSAYWPGTVLRYPKHGLARRLHLRLRNKSLGKAVASRLERYNVPQRYWMAVNFPPPPAEELTPVIALDVAEKAAANTLITRHTGEIGPLAILHPYATHPHKAWPSENWLKLCELLSAAGWRWAVVGRDEAPLLGRADPRDLTNMTDIRQTCALLSQAHAVVTGDSGPMHLAAGVQTPVVALFGPTTRAWGFFPAGPRDVVLQDESLDCRPCSLHGKTVCPRNHACLRHIAPERVLEALQGLAG